MKSDVCVTPVLTVPRVDGGGAKGVSIDGRVVEIGQGHLVVPFLGLVGSVERIAHAGCAGGGSADERACVEEAYRSVHGFFRALLPSAREELVHDLTYSVALLLVGEALEVGQVVAAGPAAGGATVGEGRADR